MLNTNIKKTNKVLFFILVGLFIVILTSQITIYFGDEGVNLNNVINNFMKSQKLNGFFVIFLSIILDAFPFIMIGVLVSSLIQIFVSEEMIARIIPKNRILGLLMASMVGIIFPVCDCAVVPVARRFLKKGVPISICITFLLAVPIVNPISIVATYYAFANNPMVMIIRIISGIGTAILVGFIMGYVENINNPLKRSKIIAASSLSYGHEHNHNHRYSSKGLYSISNRKTKIHTKECQHHSHVETCSCGHVHQKRGDSSSNALIMDILDHISIELYEVGKYLIFGALLSAGMQTVISREYLLSISKGPVSSIFLMQILAFVLSICSTADAFIAKSFVGQFSSGSIITFLVMGPMLDIKNTMMLSETFRPVFLVKLILWILLITFFVGIIVNYLYI